MYGAEEGADSLIDRLSKDKVLTFRDLYWPRTFLIIIPHPLNQDPILRCGAMHAIATAYAGTANNKAIRQLLHVAVSDVSDDVRRTSVMALGFSFFPSR